ncbi:hypothetical protein HYU22_05085 [Candidatus Woesearchaeota archaeon]|nr:hypothetical protein [Candidatus Woesearchaeota archaeon]
MTNQPNLEETIREKVTPLLEETMEKHWGITIPQLETDITDRLKSPQLQVYLPLGLSFPRAKKKFKAEFMKRELQLHRGNVSQLAKVLGLDRRSIHRAIHELDININKMRGGRFSAETYRQTEIDIALRSTLDQYKELIRPQKLESLYQDVPSLSKSIAQILPHWDLTWKAAEREFEKQFLVQALKENSGSISKTAVMIRLRPETVQRKVKRLGLRGTR